MITFDPNTTWQQNYDNCPDEFKTQYQNAPSHEKTAVLIRGVSNAYTWLTDYQQLDGLQDDDVFIWYIERLGTTVNEAAQTIQRTKNLEDYSRVDRKLVELFHNNKKTGVYIPIEDNLNLDFELDNLSGNTASQQVNFWTKGNLTFNQLFDQISKVSFSEKNEKEIGPSELDLTVDTSYNSEMLIKARDKPIFLSRLTISPEVATRIIGNSYISKEVLVLLSQLAMDIRKLILSPQQYAISLKILQNQRLTDEEMELSKDLTIEQKIMPLDDDQLLMHTIPSNWSSKIQSLSIIINPKVGKYINQNLPEYYHKISVAILAIRVRNYVDLSKPITRGHVLPQDLVKYLSEYNINECETLRKLYMGSITTTKFTDDFLTSLNDFNNYEMNLVFRGAPGKKIFRLILIVLLMTPPDILRLEEMPRFAQGFYKLLLLLCYEDHTFIIKELITGEENLQGFVKNSLNYLIYWICKGHKEFIVPLFKLFSRFEWGAMYDQHKQVLNMLDTQSFLLHEISIEDESSDFINEGQFIQLLNSMLVQTWYKPVFVKKFSKQIRGQNMNELYCALGYSQLVNSSEFKSKFNELDINKYEEKISSTETVEVDKVLSILNKIDRDIVREHFNIVYHRDLSTGVMEIQTGAWNRFFTEVTGLEVDFTTLKFLSNQHETTNKGGIDDNYGTGNFKITNISATSIDFEVSDGVTKHEINPTKSVKLFAGKERKSEFATNNKDRTILDRLKSNYEKYRIRHTQFTTSAQTGSGNNNSTQTKVPNINPAEQPNQPKKQQKTKNEKKTKTKSTEGTPSPLKASQIAYDLLKIMPDLKLIYDDKTLSTWITNKTGISVTSNSPIEMYQEVSDVLKRDIAIFEEFLDQNPQILTSNDLEQDLIRLLKTMPINTTDDVRSKLIRDKAIVMFKKITNKELPDDHYDFDPEFSKYLGAETKKFKMSDYDLQVVLQNEKEKRMSLRNTFNFFKNFKNIHE